LRRSKLTQKVEGGGMTLVSRESQVERRREVDLLEIVERRREFKTRSSPLERKVERSREVWEWYILLEKQKRVGGVVVFTYRLTTEMWSSSMFSVILNVSSGIDRTTEA